MKNRIVALFIAICVSAASALPAFANNFREIDQKVAVLENEEASAEAEAPQTDENADAEEAPGSEDDEEVIPNVPYFVQPTDYLYRAFNDVINLYVEQHLYEFTREEALEKFLYDMIEKHPEYYAMYLNTFLGTMDKYSSLHERGSGFLSVTSPNAGYGIVMDQTSDRLAIKSVLKGSTAEAAGILPGDVIVNIMGIDVSGMPWTPVSDILRKPYAFLSTKDERGRYSDYNPVISLTVDRAGTQITVPLQKGVMVPDEITYQYYEKEQVGYLAISSFLGETLAEDFTALIQNIHNQGVRKLIVDLRDNGGGSLELVMDMAENFVAEGETMCYLNNRTMEQPEAVISDTPKVEFDSISVLVNGNTASAAELMASILRNKAGAVLVGKTTYGKALGQTVYNFMSGDYMTITTYEVLDANGESYNEIGLTPELELNNVEMYYEFPELGKFDYDNYLDIMTGVYTDTCLALEKRLELIGYLKSDKVDGVWDEDTRLAVYILQTTHLYEGGGYLNLPTVAHINSLVNSYDGSTYYEDSQLDVALIYHSSLSQAKRMIDEKLILAKRQKKLIDDYQAVLEECAREEEARLDAEEAAAAAEKAAE